MNDIVFEKARNKLISMRNTTITNNNLVNYITIILINNNHNF